MLSGKCNSLHSSKRLFFIADEDGYRKPQLVNIPRIMIKVSMAISETTGIKSVCHYGYWY